MQQLAKGTLLHGGTYKIEQVLGQGSFGITYLAIHTALSKKVAIKEFFMKELNGRDEDGSVTGMSDGSLSMDYARKFQKEALNLSRLDHPNIVRVTDSFADNSTYYYVMDYIEGENLNDYIRHTNIFPHDAIRIIHEVAKALQYMHEEKHMLHLDLKPGNIMRRSSDGHIFIIDFGLSKHYSSNGQPETSTTIGLGTQGYAPIEQANQAKNGEFRPTIDVYALGATFYKLLTRETPPAASELVSDEDLLLKQLQTHNVNPQLSDFVVHAMCPNVRKRTQTVRDFLSSLPGDITSKPIGTSYTDASTYSSYDEETRFDNQFAREKIVAEPPKETVKPKKEGLWHEFVRLSNGTECVYSSRIGKVFAIIIFPILLLILLWVIVRGFYPEIDFLLDILDRYKSLFLFWNLLFFIFAILYFIARIWHFFKYGE